MQWGSYIIMTAVIIFNSMAPVFAQTSQQYSVKDTQSGQSFIVNYGITGATLDYVSINHQDTSVIVYIKSTSDGNLTIDYATGSN